MTTMVCETTTVVVDVGPASGAEDENGWLAVREDDGIEVDGAVELGPGTTMCEDRRLDAVDVEASGAGSTIDAVSHGSPPGDEDWLYIGYAVPVRTGRYDWLDAGEISNKTLQ